MTKYRVLIKNIDWSGQDKYGFVVTALDPFVILKAAEAPASVIAAFELARDAGYDVCFEAHSCNIGGSEQVSAVGVKDPVVRAAFDEIDRSGVPDNRYIAMGHRWNSGEHRIDKLERWEWTTDVG